MDVLLLWAANVLWPAFLQVGSSPLETEKSGGRDDLEGPLAVARTANRY